MLDANVIRGHLTTNVLLTLAEHDIVEPHWSQEVLVEARRNRPKRMSEEEFDRRLRAMNGFFPEAMASGYDDLKPHMLADDGDKHVLAAAVHGHCDTLVTENTKHFSPPASGAHAMRVSRLSETTHDPISHRHHGGQANAHAAWLRSTTERSRPTRTARHQRDSAAREAYTRSAGRHSSSRGGDADVAG